MTITLAERLAALDIADRDYTAAIEDHHSFPSWIPTDFQERIAYRERKDRINTCRSQFERAQAHFITESLLQYRQRSVSNV